MAYAIINLTQNKILGHTNILTEARRQLKKWKSIGRDRIFIARILS